MKVAVAKKVMNTLHLQVNHVSRLGRIWLLLSISLVPTAAIIRREGLRQGGGYTDCWYERFGMTLVYYMP